MTTGSKMFELTINIDVVANSEAEAQELLQDQMDNMITANKHNDNYVLGYGVERDKTRHWGSTGVEVS